jgi:hypothetical protein
LEQTVSSFYFAFADRGMPSQQVLDYVDYTQNEFYFHLAALKNSRIVRLREHFSKNPVKTIYLSANISGFEFSLPGVNVAFLEKGFFNETDPVQQITKRTQLENSIVIVNNNDVGHGGDVRNYADFYDSCDKTIFIAWDWDNHHWLELSTFLAAHSDIYSPAHHENLYLLSRFNWLTAGPVYCGTVQWSRNYLSKHLPDMLRAARSDEPLGKHIPYGPFRFRNQVIATLNKHFPLIGFSDHSFHNRTTEERFAEWCGHKSHWVIPVLNDVPIRIFDALSTGGIAIVPESLRYLPPVSSISLDHIIFFTPHDIIQPRSIVAKANQLFDRGGEKGLRKRQQFALKEHHGDTRIKQMLGYAQGTFGLATLKISRPGR